MFAWPTIDVCFCCESLRPLSWVFCGDRLTIIWRLLLLRILGTSVGSLLRWSPDQQLTIAFAGNPCGFCRESFAVIAWRSPDEFFCWLNNQDNHLLFLCPYRSRFSIGSPINNQDNHVLVLHVYCSGLSDESALSQSWSKLNHDYDFCLSAWR